MKKNKNIRYELVKCVILDLDLGFFHLYKFCPLDIVVAAVGMVISVVVISVLAVVLVAIVVVGSLVVVAVVVLMVVVVVVVLVVVQMVESVDTVVDSGSEFTSLSIVNRTNVNIPTARSAPRTRKRENGLKLHLLCFRVDTWPSLGGLPG